MSNEKRGFQGGIRVKPNVEGVAKEGEINVDGNSKIKAFLDSAEREVVTADQDQTLTKKAIDGTSSGTNTITIDATSALYDNTSSGLTATNSQDAIDELNTNIASFDDHTNPAVLTTKHAADLISVTPSGNLAATDAQAAFDELQSDVDTRATSTDLTDHIADTEDAHDASAISNIPFGNLAATDLQGAVNELQTDIDTRATNTDLTSHTGSSAAHGVSSAIVGTTDIQTLTNKAIDVDDNTIDGFHTNSFLLSNGSGKVFADSEVGGNKAIPTGDVVGTSDSQTLTNKTITGASVESPNRLDVKKDTLSNLETYASTASDGQLVFATDTKQTFVIKNGVLAEFSGSGGGSSDLESISVDLESFTGADYLRNISSNRAYSIKSDTLNLNHTDGSTESVTVSSIPSKFLNKDVELSMSFRSSSTPDSITVTANGETHTLVNDNSVTYSGGKWDTQLPDMPSNELSFDIGQLTTESATIQVAFTDEASTHYTNAYQLVDQAANENIQNEAYYDSYSSSYYNRTFVTSASGYSIVNDSNLTEIPDDVNITPNSFFLDKVYFSAIGATSGVTVDDVNGRGFFAQGQQVAATNNPNVANASFSSYGNSGTLNSVVVDMAAHNGEMLVAAGSLYYSVDTSISSGLGLAINSSILGPKTITRDPVTGNWYVGNNAGNVYELTSVSDTSPTLLNTYTDVEGIAAYNGRIWVANPNGIDVIGYGSILSGVCTDVTFDVRSNMVYATTTTNLYGCTYSENSMESLRAIGRFSGNMVLSSYGARDASQGSLTGSQSDKVYIVEQNADGFMVIHGAPISQITDMSIRLKENSDSVIFQKLANSSTGVQTITQSNFAVRELDSQIGQSSFMSLSANQINLKRGSYIVEYKAQQYDGEGYIALQGTSGGTLTITNGESTNMIGHVGGTPIVTWHQVSCIVDVDADDADIYFFHFADSSETRSTLTGYGARVTDTPIMEVKVTKL